MSTNLKSVLRKHAEIELQITAIEESLSLITENFAPRDGIQPISIAVTGDGKRVPVQIFIDFIEKIRQQHLDPLKEEQSKIEEMKIEY